MNLKKIFLIKSILFLGIAIYLAFTFDKALSNLVFKSGISWFYGSIVLRLMICLAFARGLQLVFKAFESKIKGILTFLIGLTLGFGISFIARPIYDLDYGHYENSNLKLDLEALNKQTNYSLSTNNKPALIAFFHTDCNGCKEMSKDIGKYQKLGHIPQVIALFGGTEEDALTFMTNQNGQNFTYHMISDEDYFKKTADYAFPAVYYVNSNGETITFWHSSGLSYHALDIIKENK